MLLRYSFDLGKEADLVETAVENVLKAGYRTGDLLVGNTQGTKKVGTQEMGDAIVKENRVRFHLIPFARTGGRGSTGHDGFG